ncbi:bifunctional diaminohydroxyphosphoribosylaminopyrimidine deaminase/5-amino-6-(5-phosphoribosylamino)uracil reductase RibD [Bacteroidota bacterium]
MNSEKLYNSKMTEQEAMSRAIELAMKGSGFVSPNPRVGAVILKNDKIISEGWHKKFGGHHAEVEAVRNAKDVDLNDATMVVNLEPCSHTGKTPPCVDLIIEKKFKKVVIGMKDPNPLVKGKGINKLRKAGIEVVSGVLEEEAKWINRFFTKHITSGLPYVVLKTAQSLDGKIATHTGESQWITCKESRKFTHKLRAELDAVLVGRKTVEADNPQLNVREVKGRNPIKVILDTYLSLPASMTIFQSVKEAKTIVCCSDKAANSQKAKILKNAGIILISVDIDNQNRIDLRDCLKKLSVQYQIASVLVEGGAEIHSSFIKHNLADEIHFFIAPKIIGKGIGSFDDILIKKLNDAREFEVKEISKSGVDVHLVAISK